MASISVVGPVLISGVLSCFTSGMVAVKVYQYYARFGKDPLPFKLLVGSCAVATLVSAMTWPNWPYDWLVRNFGQTGTQARIHIANIISNACIANIIVAVQSFFAWRVYKLSGAMSSRLNLIIPGLITVTSIAQFIPLVFVIQWIGKDRKTSDWGHTYIWGIWWGCASGAGDLMITCSMTYLLLIKTRKDAGMSQSRYLFRGIVRRAAQTNLLSLFFQVAVVLVLHFSAGLWFLPATGSVAQIYTFSLLTSLSARSSHDARGSSDNVSTNPRRNTLAADRVTVTIDRSQRVDDERIHDVEPGMFDVRFDHPDKSSMLREGAAAS